MKRIILFILTILFYCQCSTNKSNNSITYYTDSEGKIEFELDSLTPNYANHMQLVQENGINKLFILSPFNNRILGYDFDNFSKLEDFSILKEDMNNISFGDFYHGFFIHNKDSIFFLSNISKLILSNNQGEYSILFDFIKHTDDRDYWPKLTQFNKPILLNDSIISIGGMYQSNAMIHSDEVLVEMNFNMNKKTFELNTPLPKGVYKEGNFYFPDRVRPGRVFSKKHNKIFYSFPNADSIYVKDLLNIKTGLKGIFAKEEKLQPFIEIDNNELFAEFVTEKSKIYQTQQGGYNSIFVNDNKNLLVRSAYLGIKDYDIEKHNNREYSIDKALMFFDLNNYQHLKTIYLKNIDERFLFFDDDYFYVYCFDSQKEEDKLVFDKYAYPEFD